MRAHLGIRARLAAVVTVAFAAVAVIGAIAIIGFVERRLVESTRNSAVAALGSYTRGVSSDGRVVATADLTRSGAFFYLDAEGHELTEQEYVDLIVSMMHDADADPGGNRVGDGGESETTGGTPGQDGQDVIIRVDASPVGNVYDVDRGSDVIAVAQRIQFPDGTEVQVGAAVPRQPVDDALSALRTILWIVLPTLTVLVGVLAYITARRALRPVHSITQRTRAISDTNLSERVPVPATRDEIGELATTMNDMLGRLDGAQQRQRRFIADASHELRSPIAASCAQLEVALAHPDRADWQTTATTVLNEQTHLGHFVDDLLALSRLDEQGPGSTSQVDLAEIVRAETARPHRSCVRAQTDGPAWVMGNSAQLERAVRNLIDNADRYASAAVIVTITDRAHSIVVDVDDDGPGIPADQRETVFDRFTRADDHRNRARGGAGLGLAIVRSVAQAHGGRAHCTTAPTGGARLTIELPAAGTG